MVEQGTHKPLVVSSTLTLATLIPMNFVGIFFISSDVTYHMSQSPVSDETTEVMADTLTTVNNNCLIQQTPISKPTQRE